MWQESWRKPSRTFRSIPLWIGSLTSISRLSSRRRDPSERSAGPDVPFYSQDRLVYELLHDTIRSEFPGEVCTGCKYFRHIRYLKPLRMLSVARPIFISLVVFADSQVRLTTKHRVEERFVDIRPSFIVCQHPRYGRISQEAVNSPLIGLEPKVSPVNSRWTIGLDPPKN